MLYAVGGLAATAALSRLAAQSNLPKLKITGFELLPVRATSRTVWLFLRLKSDSGITGLGEVSDAFGFANTTVADAAAMRVRFAEIAAKGYAWAFEEFLDGLNSVAAPIRDRNGNVVGAIHVHGPAYRFPGSVDSDDVGQLVATTAERVQL